MVENGIQKGSITGLESRKRIREIATETKSGGIINATTLGEAREVLNQPNANPLAVRAGRRVIQFHEALDPQRQELIENGGTVLIDFVGNVLDRPNPSPKTAK